MVILFEHVVAGALAAIILAVPLGLALARLLTKDPAVEAAIFRWRRGKSKILPRTAFASTSASLVPGIGKSTASAEVTIIVSVVRPESDRQFIIGGPSRIPTHTSTSITQMVP